ncbi:MAG: UvrD-helicase domain-containing protein [Adlercreutzia equolifaciens]
MAIELTPTPEAVLVEGAVGCGKTTRLVERAAALLEGGAAPSDLLVLAATPDAARMLAARLEAACGAAVEATCVREVALGLLATEGGRAFSDRAGRLVTPVEMGFIMEDMKTCGLKNRRLKEMLKFFYRSWTELVEDADGNADWLLAGEEADVHGLLKGILDFTGGILEPELSALAVRYLLADGEALAGAQRAHVLVDDYQMLSRASQHVANLLARDSIAVAADPAAVVEVFDSYPYGEGVGEFTQANADCERIVLTESHACGAAAHAASRLREDAAPGAPEITGVGDAPATDSFTARESADPAAEVAAVAEAVEAALGAGCAPEDVYVLTFHPAWMRQVLRALAARDIAAAAPVEGRLSVGDYRDLDRCAPARLLAALDLAADPANALAWRSWCGFGDYLANSAAFADMRAGAAAEGAGLVALLEEASAAAPAEGFPNTGIGRIVDAYRAGRELVASVQGLEGDGLLDALAAGLGLEGDGAARARALVGALTAPAPARGRHRCRDPEPPGAAGPGRRGLRRHRGPGARGRPEHLVGRSPAVLVLAGFVNGFFPSRDYFDATVMTPDKQKLARATDIRRLYAAAGKPTERLVASWFTSIDLVGAEQLKLEIGRVRLRRGERIATTSPSIYLKEIEPTEDQSA